jgi:hypothetical protein
MAGKRKSPAESGKSSTDSVPDNNVASLENSGVGKKKKISMTQRAELKFPVARTLSNLRRGRYADHIQKGK